MDIDLTQEGIFEDNTVNFDKKVNFIFGKNGTGKSTIAKLIKGKKENFDVRVFQGFEGVVDSNNILNAVILGEENVEINRQINSKFEEITSKDLERKIILKEISEPENGEVNSWQANKNATEKFTEKENEIDKFYRESAASIKRLSNPQISNTTYNFRNFKNEILEAKLFQDTEILKLKEVLKSERKTAKTLILPNIDLKVLLEDVNEILKSRVEEKIIIKRLENDNNKRAFAKKGMEIHGKGEICAFCGNIITNEKYEELEKYFSVNEVEKLQKQIDGKKKEIDRDLADLNAIHINKESFYPEFSEKINSLNSKIDDLRESQKDFLLELKRVLEKKSSNLFEECEEIDATIPLTFNELELNYQNLRDENNSNDLPKMQNEAKKKLRCHEIKRMLNKFNYDVKKEQLKVLKVEKDRMESELNEKKVLIKGEMGIDSEISQLQRDIKLLQEKTKNEEKLAEDINKKIKTCVPFELVYCNEDSHGCYQIKSLITGEIRDVMKLSTGEKNIIAFLYFIEKLDEVEEDVQKKIDKVIVFDDPMNSNDDTMQYLIIDELQKLMKKIIEKDKFILLTHNSHFYLNVKYRRKYNKDKFIRLVSNGSKTKIKILKKESEDYKTNYEALWVELKFLFDNKDTSPEMLLNPIRRIIETFIKFNGIKEEDFYETQNGARKFFNVNSHSIDDLEAELNGKTKDKIKEIMEKCFEDNGAIEHFNKYWKCD